MQLFKALQVMPPWCEACWGRQIVLKSLDCPGINYVKVVACCGCKVTHFCCSTLSPRIRHPCSGEQEAQFAPGSIAVESDLLSINVIKLAVEIPSLTVLMVVSVSG